MAEDDSLGGNAHVRPLKVRNFSRSLLALVAFRKGARDGKRVRAWLSWMDLCNLRRHLPVVALFRKRNPFASETAGFRSRSSNDDLEGFHQAENLSSDSYRGITSRNRSSQRSARICGLGWLSQPRHPFVSDAGTPGRRTFVGSNCERYSLGPILGYDAAAKPIGFGRECSQRGSNSCDQRLLDEADRL